MQLSGIKVISSAVCIDTTKLVMRATKLPPPQDIRYALFSLDAQQRCVNIFKTHLSQLKKRVLIRQTSDTSAQLTFQNGIIAEIAIDECYPEVPDFNPNMDPNPLLEPITPNP